MRTRHSHLVTVAVLFVVALGSIAQAQQPSTPRPPTPLKVQVVISRYQAEKKVSSLPYLLTLTANGNQSRGSLRLGSQVPIATPTIADGKTTSSFTYKDVGTNIDVTASPREDGTYSLQITVSDSSIYPENQTGAAAARPSLGPSFHTFQATNYLVLKDGATSEFTAAADRISGEVTKVEVTLTVLK